MNLDKFEGLIGRLGRDDVVTMRENAIEKGALKHVALAERALDHRFPGWREPVRFRRGGGKATTVHFQGKVQVNHPE